MTHYILKIYSALIFCFILLITMHTYSYAVCVKVSEANLRSGPGTTYEKTWEVFKYMPFKKLSSKGNWYNVEDVDSDKHWIYKKLTTDKFDCAVTKVDTANIRSGPGEQYKKTSFSPSLKYDSFKVIQRKGKWVKVRDEFGDEGWIFRTLVWIY